MEKENAISKLLKVIFGKGLTKDVSLRIPIRSKGIVINTKIVKQKTVTILIYIVEKKRIQIGDKISGRHGNKGIISRILPKKDMPYLPDGTSVDIVLNPLGIPSRMNVGQVFECLLGLCGKNLKEKYILPSFDEFYGVDVSKNLIYNKLYETSLKTRKNWIFNPNYPGKVKLFDGKTGNVFEQSITVGYSYILKLMHVSSEKITSRSTGPYSIITKQPLKGKSRNGGQRFGEMEVWAVEGYGSSYVLQEIITLKSDDLTNKYKTLHAIVEEKLLPTPLIPESFKVFILELKSLCFNVSIYNETLDGKIF